MFLKQWISHFNGNLNHLFIFARKTKVAETKSFALNVLSQMDAGSIVWPFFTNARIRSYIAYFDFFPSMDGGAFPIVQDPNSKPAGWTGDHMSSHRQEGWSMEGNLQGKKLPRRPPAKDPNGLWQYICYF